MQHPDYKFCVVCGQRYHRTTQTSTRWAQRVVCSRVCAARRARSAERRDERAPRINASGYRDQWCPRRQRYVYEHRLVMEKVLGRELQRSEIVHHINGDRLDNRPANLEVMTQAEHMRLHWQQNPNLNGLRKPAKPCAWCGRPCKSPRHIRECCSLSCAGKLRWARIKQR